MPTRRRFCAQLAAGAAAVSWPCHARADQRTVESVQARSAPADATQANAEQAGPSPAGASTFRLRYILSSAMYGPAPLADIMPQASRTGAGAIDLWPQPHGKQREQVDAMGVEAFADLLKQHEVQLGGIACYRFGALGLQAQMKLAEQLKAREVALVCGGSGPKDATGEALKAAVRTFVEQLKPHHDAAQRSGCLIAIENHANNVISSPDSLKYLAEFAASMPNLGIAFAPHHLPQDAAMQAGLIEQLGAAVKFFYAQQHGKGSTKRQPKEDELLQMPGRGALDFKPLLAALKKIQFAGYTEIFMHPFPRGVPILDSPDAITAEINRSRAYLEQCLKELP